MNSHSHKFSLSAAQCNAQRELSPAMLAQLLIECATEHADRLGIGYARMQTDGSAWVLSRMAFEMKRYPGIREPFTITTWIEDLNRHFSQRNFEIRAEESGDVIGYARTIWVAIDLLTRRPASLDGIRELVPAMPNRACPIERPVRLRPIESPDAVRDYLFRLSDIDFNRHVNSARYIELMLNSLTLDDFDRCYLQRFDVEYKQESYFGQTATVSSTLSPTGVMDSDIAVEGRHVCLSRSILTPRNK